MSEGIKKCDKHQQVPSQTMQSTQYHGLLFIIRSLYLHAFENNDCEHCSISWELATYLTDQWSLSGLPDSDGLED